MRAENFTHTFCMTLYTHSYRSESSRMWKSWIHRNVSPAPHLRPVSAWAAPKTPSRWDRTLCNSDKWKTLQFPSCHSAPRGSQSVDWWSRQKSHYLPPSPSPCRTLLCTNQSNSPKPWSVHAALCWASVSRASWLCTREKHSKAVRLAAMRMRQQCRNRVDWFCANHRWRWTAPRCSCPHSAWSNAETNCWYIADQMMRPSVNSPRVSVEWSIFADKLRVNTRDCRQSVALLCHSEWVDGFWHSAWWTSSCSRCRDAPAVNSYRSRDRQRESTARASLHYDNWVWCLLRSSQALSMTRNSLPPAPHWERPDAPSARRKSPVPSSFCPCRQDRI